METELTDNDIYLMVKIVGVFHLFKMQIALGVIAMCGPDGSGPRLDQLRADRNALTSTVTRALDRYDTFSSVQSFAIYVLKHSARFMELYPPERFVEMLASYVDSGLSFEEGMDEISLVLDQFVVQRDQGTLHPEIAKVLAMYADKEKAYALSTGEVGL